FAAETFGHPLFDLSAIDVDQLPKDPIDKKLVASLRVLALRKRGNRLAVGVSDPTNLQALDQIKFQTQLAVDIVVVEHEKFDRIRFRVDGILREVAQPPLAIRERLVTRIKVISRLDISEKRVPQDGRMKLALSGQRAIDFRVSTLPTLYGEKIVMRILDA